MSRYSIHAHGDQVILDRRDGEHVDRTHYAPADFRKLMGQGMAALAIAESRGLPGTIAEVPQPARPVGRLRALLAFLSGPGGV